MELREGGLGTNEGAEEGDDGAGMELREGSMTDKKEKEIFLIYKKFRWDRVQVIYEEGLPNI